MSMHERTASTILLALALGWGTAVAAEGQKFGQPIAPADFAAWDISIAPDGSIWSGRPWNKARASALGFNNRRVFMFERSGS